jgi:hypothetical protein
MIIDQKYNLPYKKFPDKGPSTQSTLCTNHHTIPRTISCPRGIAIEFKIVFCCVIFQRL